MRELEALKRRYEGHVPDLMGVRRRFAVLCPFVEIEGQTHLLFEVRAAGLRQAGEVCFPGGRMETGESAAECAARETEEELGIPASEIRIFAESDFQAGQDGLMMRATLGEISPAGLAAMKPSEAEVAEVFTVPLEFFLHTPPELYTYELVPLLPEDFPYETIGIPRDYKWQQGGETVPVYPWEGHPIWGLTGRITRHLMQWMERWQ